MKWHTDQSPSPAVQQDTILVVDDNPENIRLLFEALKEDGFRTLAAVNGERAVEQTRLAHPDLILMDVMMPGMDGFGACRKLKADPETRAIPVIFMTALSETVDKVRGFEAGGVDYLTKPLQHGEVVARIHAHLGRHRLWREIDSYSRLLQEMGAADSLAGAWAALSSLVQDTRELAGLALWERTESSDELTLTCHAGFPGGGPSSWKHNQGDYSRIPVSDPLLGEAVVKARQVPAPDPGTWAVYPEWAAVHGLKACIATPVTCRNEGYGVLFAAYHHPAFTGFTEQQRWQRILAQHLGNVIFQSRSMDAIRDLGKQLQHENQGLRAEISIGEPAEELIGDSHSFRRVVSQLDLVASTDTAVLILGESGTGKELLAQRLHHRSPRSDAPLIRVNCAAIPGELFESEFFGHVKGAFTGAVQDRVGRFELANGGTLFLDEIGEIPLDLQGKLLRVLQEGTFERVGEEKTRHSNVRVVAATNRDLYQAVEEGWFREDLYYRLSVFPLTVPPLRDRKTDLPSLIRYFMTCAARRLGLPPPDVTDAQLEPFLDYSWPGNIRELQNEIERVMILSRGQQPAFPPPGGDRINRSSIVAGADRILTEEECKALQRDNILRALKASNWRVDGPGGAAELLGLRPTTLRSRMKTFEIKRRFH